MAIKYKNTDLSDSVAMFLRQVTAGFFYTVHFVIALLLRRYLSYIWHQ
ncbi:hypothetical protein [Orbus hercynius]|nr:hypothetical protein [Orbus hercynius]